MFKFIRQPIAIVSMVIIFGGVGAYFLFIRKSASGPETALAKRGTVTQEVSVTGNTKAAQDIDLAFEQGGKVRRFNADVGDKVAAGQILIELDSSELSAQLREEEANISTQQAKLDELKRGPRSEELAVYEAKVVNAQSTLTDAKTSLIAAIEDAYTKSDDAVRNKVDQYFSNPRSSSPAFVFTIGNSFGVENARVTIEYLLTSWKSSLDKLDISSELDSYVGAADSNLDQIKSFLEKNALMLNSLIANSNLTQTSIDTYRSAVSTARTNVNTAITNLQTAEGTLTSAKSDLSLAEKNLTLEKAGSTPEAIAAQAALVKKAQASADVIRVKIEKNLLRSPIDGIITRQDAKVGQIISVNTTIVSVISSGGFEIEANIPEADIAKVKIDDSAKLTLDAFGSGVVFEARVIKIDPGETIIEGVATYKTTFQFVTENAGIKSGMTANIDIITGQKENVVYIPQRALISSDGDKFVRIFDADGKIRKVKVEAGIRGSDGNVEIIAGINEGDKVITSLGQ